MSKVAAMMVVFAGNNGSSKNTIRNLMVDNIGVCVNINPTDLDRRKVSTRKEAIQLSRECISHERDFSGDIILQAEKRGLTYQAESLPDWALSIQNELDRLRGSDEFRNNKKYGR